MVARRAGLALEPGAAPHEHRLALVGGYALADASALWSDLARATGRLRRGDRLQIDLTEVEHVDGAAMALLVHLRATLIRRGVGAELAGARPQVHVMVELYAGADEPAVRPRAARAESGLAAIGRRTLEVGGELRGALGFVGELVRASVGLVRRPSTGNWRALMPMMVRTGTEAVPIILLINFLVGFVLAYQASGQLAQFGANIYVANLVGVSMARAMGPLMTAVIVCGRSGAAFAAELGTMQVSEELDALRTLGLGPMRYLVVPRVLALVVVVPILTLLGMAAGIVGGMLVAASQLDVPMPAYVTQLQLALTPWDVWTGLLKSVAFALAIAIIACQQGFATTGGAQGVGRRTTSSVVIILFSLILLDAGLTLVFAKLAL